MSFSQLLNKTSISTRKINMYIVHESGGTLPALQEAFIHKATVEVKGRYSTTNTIGEFIDQYNASNQQAAVDYANSEVVLQYEGQSQNDIYMRLQQIATNPLDAKATVLRAPMNRTPTVIGIYFYPTPAHLATTDN